MYLTTLQILEIKEIIKPLVKIVGDENQVLEAVKQVLKADEIPSGGIYIYTARSFGKRHFQEAYNSIRKDRINNTIVVDDIDEPLRTSKEQEYFIKNHTRWIETYFPRYASINNTYPIRQKPEAQKIKLGVRKRYIKVPKIQMLTGRQYFEFHFKVTDKLTKKVMKQKKYPKRPTLKAESIFDAEKRLRQEAKDISNIFEHIKPTKYLLKR